MAGEGSQWPSEGVKAACRFPLQLESDILPPTDPSAKILVGRSCSISEWLPRALQSGLGWEFPSWKKGVYSQSMPSI